MRCKARFVVHLVIYKTKVQKYLPEIRATSVNRHHQVVALHARINGVSQLDGAGIVDQDVDSSKRFQR